jgi:putative ATP-binding cassette transporter
VRRIGHTLAQMARLSLPYFRSDDGWVGRGLLGAILAIELTQVGIAVLLNAWNARFYDALQNKNAAAFGYELLIFAALVATLGSELPRRGRLASAGDPPALPGRQ